MKIFTPRELMISAAMVFLLFTFGCCKKPLNIWNMPEDPKILKPTQEITEENKPTLFFIHGFAVGPWYFDNFRQFFEQKGFTCVTPTLRYHDVDPDQIVPELGDVGIMDYVSDLEKELAQLNEHPVIIGHSMGGLLAQILTYKGYSRATILVQPAPPKGISLISLQYLPYHFDIIGEWGWWKKPVKYGYEDGSYLYFNQMPEADAKALYARTVHDSGKAILDMLTGNSTEIDATTIDTKMLVVAGKQDRAISPDIVQKIARKYGENAFYKEFDNHGHEIFMEPGWEKVAEYIYYWIESPESGLEVQNITENTNNLE